MRLIFVCFFLVVGCAPRGDSNTQAVDSTPAEVREFQSQRTTQFEQIVGFGVIEFTWTDERGAHKDQGELDFWKQGDSISLRISKLGELLAWFGGKGTELWFFDMMGEEPTLTIGGDQGMFNDVRIALVLLGLEPLPEGTMEVRNGVVTLTDANESVWVATFDPTTNRPLKIQRTDEQHISTASHQKGISVEIENLHELYWPVTGGLIDLSDTRNSTEIKIAFSSLSTIVEDEPMNRVFDLNYLRNALKPTQVFEGNE